MVNLTILSCVLLLAYGTIAETIPEIEETYVRVLYENIQQIPNLLSENGVSPKIDIKKFGHLSSSLAEINVKAVRGDNNFEHLLYDHIIQSVLSVQRGYDLFVNYLKDLNERRLYENILKAGYQYVGNKLFDEFETLLKLLFMDIDQGMLSFVELKNVPLCGAFRSKQGVFYELYKATVLASLMDTIANLVYRTVLDNNEYDVEALVKEFIDRKKSTYLLTKTLIGKISRDIYACAPKRWSKDFATVNVMKATLVYGLENGTEPGDCDGQDALTTCCQRQSFLGDGEKGCNGFIDDCTYSVNFCNGPKNNFPSNYHPLTDYELPRFATESEDFCDKVPLYGKYCTSDVCNCLDRDEEISRYFHFGPAISDIEENKVVTGVRIYREGPVFYLQIQQGKLKENGHVDPTTVDWKPIKSKITSIKSYKETHPNWRLYAKTNDFYTITHKRKTIYLDDVFSPPSINANKSHAVIGIKFVELDADLRLEVETQQFDYATGKLHGRTEWRRHEALRRTRKRHHFENAVQPLSYLRQHQVSKPGTYVQFQHTSVYRTLGESTIPYIDLQPVVTNPPAPIAGAGIFIKGTQGSGGYLALKLIAQDILTHF